jgi:hypothetical protein
MRSKLLKVTLFALVLASLASVARAQDDDGRKFEVGGQFTALRTERFVASEPGQIVCVSFPCFITGSEGSFEPGFGGRVGYNFNRHVGVEAELNLFPGDDLGEGGRKVQGLFGVKAGRRFERAGLFAKARPGFLRASRGDLGRIPDRPCIAIFPPPAACFDDAEPTTSFALDVGGVLELYPSGRTLIRFDAGDTIVRQGERGVLVNPPSGDPLRGVVLPVAAETTHNFQASVGFGVRF